MVCFCSFLLLLHICHIFSYFPKEIIELLKFLKHTVYIIESRGEKERKKELIVTIFLNISFNISLPFLASPWIFDHSFLCDHENCTEDINLDPWVKLVHPEFYYRINLPVFGDKHEVIF